MNLGQRPMTMAGGADLVTMRRLIVRVSMLVLSVRVIVRSMVMNVGSVVVIVGVRAIVIIVMIPVRLRASTVGQTKLRGRHT